MASSSLTGKPMLRAHTIKQALQIGSFSGIVSRFARKAGRSLGQ